MDKLIVDDRGKATISNDGATILKLLDVVHPAAKTLVDIAKSQDAEVGDGTTSVTMLAAEFLKQVKPYVEEGLHPQIIIRAFRTATQLAVNKIKEIAVTVKKEDKNELRRLLEKCASTALNSKLISQQKDFFSRMVVDAVMMLDELLQLKMIGIKKVQGGALEESQLVAGVAFKKTFSYAGFEMQPKKYKSPRIALLNIELELKAEKDNAEVRVNNVEDYQAIVDAEWSILYDKLDKIHKSGAKVVLSKLPIGDVATQYFADRDMFCAGRVPEEDLKRTMMACGGSIQTSVNSLTDEVLGLCELFEEAQIGGDRYNFFTGCPKAKTCTLILRGGAEQFMEDSQESDQERLHRCWRRRNRDGTFEVPPGLLQDHSGQTAVVDRRLRQSPGDHSTPALRQRRLRRHQHSQQTESQTCSGRHLVRGGREQRRHCR
nr:T-complex protein 1 subunit eta isoform X1 [Pelodiscus sinensis]|eukprot:XP_006115688.1 T-complex protein 1 subunit eta isoform X1 [Pelodiscus sinensis]